MDGWMLCLLPTDIKIAMLREYLFDRMPEFCIFRMKGKFFYGNVIRVGFIFLGDINYLVTVFHGKITSVWNLMHLVKSSFYEFIFEM